MSKIVAPFLFAQDLHKIRIIFVNKYFVNTKIKLCRFSHYLVQKTDFQGNSKNDLFKCLLATFFITSILHGLLGNCTCSFDAFPFFIVFTSFFHRFHIKSMMIHEFLILSSIDGLWRMFGHL